MIIKVTYDKSTGEITLDNDIQDVVIALGIVNDTPDSIDFEIAVETTQYEVLQQEPITLNPEE